MKRQQLGSNIFQYIRIFGIAALIWGAAIFFYGCKGKQSNNLPIHFVQPKWH